MQHCLLILVAAMLLPGHAWALDHYSNVAQDQNGRAIAGATISVYPAGGATPATIYADNGQTVKANPFTTAIDGVYDFYAPDGLYDIKISKIGYTSIYWDPTKTAGLSLFDPTQFIVPYGANFPTFPLPGSWFALTGDNGTCTVLSGANTTPCRWDGANWVPMGGATGGGSGSDFIAGTTKQITWANNFANAAKFLDGNNTGTAIYTDVTNGPQIPCVIAGVENACNYIRTLAAGKYLAYNNNAGTPIFTLTNDTGALTNLTLDCTQSSNLCTVPEEQWWDAASCQNTTAQAVFNLPTSNAPTPHCEGTNTLIATLDFNDTTDQSFTARWVLPVGFTGSIDVKFRWKAVSTSGAVGWCAQLVKVTPGSTSDPSLPAQASGNCISETARATTLQETDITITGVTCASCSAGDAVNITISRDANGSAVPDDMTGDAKLINWGRTWRVVK